MADNLSLRQFLGLELFRRFRRQEVRRHQLNYLFWECTLRCNLNCLHCGSDCRREAEVPDMPVEDFIRVIDTITPQVAPEQTMIVISGGEPLLRADLEKCGEELYRRRYPWGIVTNGYALTLKRLESLLNAGLRAITVSFDGLEEEHNWLRGSGKSYQRAAEAIRMIASCGVPLEWDVVTCVNRRTIGRLDAIKENLFALGVRDWRLFSIFPTGRAAHNDQLKLSPQEFVTLMDFIDRTRREGRIRASYGCEGFLGRYEGKVRDSLFYCRAGVRVGSVLADGSIGACPSIRGSFIQGNIYRDDFMSVWNQKFEPFRNREWARTGQCESCKQFRYCEGNGMHLRNEQSGELLFCHYDTIRQGSAK